MTEIAGSDSKQTSARDPKSNRKSEEVLIDPLLVTIVIIASITNADELADDITG